MTYKIRLIAPFCNLQRFDKIDKSQLGVLHRSADILLCHGISLRTAYSICCPHLFETNQLISTLKLAGACGIQQLAQFDHFLRERLYKRKFLPVCITPNTKCRQRMRDNNSARNYIIICLSGKNLVL